jgi:hypothetical protein
MKIDSNQITNYEIYKYIDNLLAVIFNNTKTKI